MSATPPPAALMLFGMTGSRLLKVLLWTSVSIAVYAMIEGIFPSGLGPTLSLFAWVVGAPLFLVTFAWVSTVKRIRNRDDPEAERGLFMLLLVLVALVPANLGAAAVSRKEVRVLKRRCELMAAQAEAFRVDHERYPTARGEIPVSPWLHRRVEYLSDGRSCVLRFENPVENACWILDSREGYWRSETWWTPMIGPPD